MRVLRQLTMTVPRTIEILLLVAAMMIIVAVVTTGCGFHIPNPFPHPTPTPTPTPTPEPPPPPPEPVCEPNTNCGCWVQPPGEGWKELVCGEGYECVEHVCREIPPTPPPEPVCPLTDEQESKLCAKVCADPIYTGCTVVCEEAGGAPTVKCYEPPPPPPPPPGICPPIVGTLYINDKPSGHGFDSSPRVRGDENFCFLVTGEHGWKDCSFEGLKNRAECEIMAMGGCPVWQYITEPQSTIAYQCHDDQNAAASCDHFGSPSAQDDPKTPDVFEGLPSACGIQRDAYGPNAGFFTVAHGGTPGCLTPDQSSFRIRACFPNNLGICGPWRPFCH